MAAAAEHGEYVAVAVLGAGIMGSAMARRLLSAGLPVTVWDRSSSATGALAAAGAAAAASAREAVRDAPVVITMLSTADVVSSVIFDGGVVDALAQGCVWAQMGTIGVEATFAIRDRLGALRPDVLFLDAPVSGSKGRPSWASCSSWRPGLLLRPTLSARYSPPSAARPCGSVTPARAAR